MDTQRQYNKPTKSVSHLLSCFRTKWKGKKNVIFSEGFIKKEMFEEIHLTCFSSLDNDTSRLGSQV